MGSNSRNDKKPNSSGPGIVRLSKYSILALFGLLTLFPLHAQVEGLLSGGLYSQYLWRGRDYTLAGAPMAALEGRAEATYPVGHGLRMHADLLALNAVARRGSPWEAASADTLRFSTGAKSAFFDGGWLGIELGVSVSWFYGAMIASGVSYGTVMIEPHAAIGLPTLYGRPQWTAVIDLTPDQVGWRGGIEWFPTFEVPWGQVEGYLGVFRPHNYLKQSSPPFLGRLFNGGLGLALEALIPSDVTVGAGSLVTLNDEMALYPVVELLVAPSRWQNPKQIVPAASLTFLYGGLGARPAIHEGR